MDLWLAEVDSRWAEIDLLLSEAGRIEHDNTQLYDALCRAAMVFVSAHFEGSIKSLVKYLIDDFNQFRGIADTPDRVRNHYLNSFIVLGSGDRDSREAQQLRQKLLPLLISNNQPIDYTVYLIDQKNPTPDILSRIAQKFGISSIFWELENSDIEAKLFSDVPSARRQKIQEIRSLLQINCANFPYTDSSSVMGRHKPQKKSNRTIYEEFIDNTLKGRHDIAHGTIMNNPRTPRDFDEIRDKVQGLQYSLLVLLTEELAGG
ncbi:HEPN domain-containing protein [Deinococcus cavernae]|nr:HEPN domain-containing protein [Deinococcus cavernae]